MISSFKDKHLFLFLITCMDETWFHGVVHGTYKAIGPIFLFLILLSFHIYPLSFWLHYIIIFFFG